MLNLAHFQTSLEENILQLTINRPTALNALSQETLFELNLTMQEIDQNDKILGVIITGSGDKAFAAGADIKEFEGLDYEKALKLSQFGQDLFSRIERSTKPFIAAINGFALGGGCELAMACHLRIGTEGSRLGQPESNLGIIPGYGGTQRLVQLVGKGKAMEWILTADPINAQEALQWGLLNHVVPTVKDLMPTCISMMKKIISKGPLSTAATIKSIQAYFNNEGYRTERELFAACAITEDFKEGTSAFIEKRKPTFKGK